jgi:Leucine-rich repeat (LRR) protein
VGEVREPIDPNTVVPVILEKLRNLEIELDQQPHRIEEICEAVNSLRTSACDLQPTEPINLYLTALLSWRYDDEYAPNHSQLVDSFKRLANSRIKKLSLEFVAQGPPRDGFIGHLDQDSFADACEANLCGLQQLSLQGLNVNAIHHRSFTQFKRLLSLTLEHFDLTRIEANGFRGLSSLTTLNLSNNRLAVLETGMFNGLDSLIELNLRFNCLNELQSGAFAALGRLERLDLRNNYLNDESMHDRMFAGLVSFKTLLIGGNQLAREENIERLRALLPSSSVINATEN